MFINQKHKHVSITRDRLNWNSWAFPKQTFVFVRFLLRRSIIILLTRSYSFLNNIRWLLLLSFSSFFFFLFHIFFFFFYYFLFHFLKFLKFLISFFETMLLWFSQVQWSGSSGSYLPGSTRSVELFLYICMYTYIQFVFHFQWLVIYYLLATNSFMKYYFDCCSYLPGLW